MVLIQHFLKIWISFLILVRVYGILVYRHHSKIYSYENDKKYNIGSMYITYVLVQKVSGRKTHLFSDTGIGFVKRKSCQSVCKCRLSKSAGTISRPTFILWR